MSGMEVESFEKFGPKYFQYISKTEKQQVALTINILYTYLLSKSFNFAGDFIERMITSQWLLTAPPCLQSH